MYQIIQGDCIEGMKTLPDQCVHTVITSPPYYGLRDYGTATWEGGDAECDHVHLMNTSTKSTLIRSKNGIAPPNTMKMTTLQYKGVCGKCGAQRIDKQIGLEETPEAYVQRIVDVFREVRRILRDDGTVWLNLGDSYGAKKQLLGIPWRVAFALQADAWYLRQDIIWHKPNPMPESVTDRCTKSHEYIFLLSKSQRYYFDHEAIKEPVQSMGKPRKFRDAKEHSDLTMRNDNGRLYIPDEHRNKRSVWSVTTRGYKEAHFAVYPTKLIEPCVLAGCPEGGTVFDPFTGSGTTALVALQYNRRYIGTELNPEYIALAEKRLSAVQICF